MEEGGCDGADGPAGWTGPSGGCEEEEEGEVEEEQAGGEGRVEEEGLGEEVPIDGLLVQEDAREVEGCCEVCFRVGGEEGIGEEGLDGGDGGQVTDCMQWGEVEGPEDEVGWQGEEDGHLRSEREGICCR